MTFNVQMEDVKNVLGEKLYDFMMNEVLPRYDLNDSAHGRDHIIDTVISSLFIARNIEFKHLKSVILAAFFHDIGCHIDRSKHEIKSKKIFDKVYKKYSDVFSELSDEEITLTRKGILQHRGSYSGKRCEIGKIVSDGDFYSCFKLNGLGVIVRCWNYAKENLEKASMPVNETILRLLVCESIKKRYSAKKGDKKLHLKFSKEFFKKDIENIYDISQTDCRINAGITLLLSDNIISVN